jgi:hypothetical protein
MMTKKIEIDKNLLEELFIKQNKTIKEVSLVFKCCKNTIGKHIKIHNLRKESYYNKYKLEDFKGKKFGKLTPIKFNGTKYKTLLDCDCDCGNKKIVSFRDLFYGNVKSCGCYRKERQRPTTISAIMSTFNRLRKTAKIRNISFDLDPQDIIDVYDKQEKKCYFTGIFVYFTKHLSYTRLLQNASVDRIDNSKGYIKGNIQIVHKLVNRMRNCCSNKEFINICNIISSKHKIKKDEIEFNIDRCYHNNPLNNKGKYSEITR